jgi:hypothetical protein
VSVDRGEITANDPLEYKKVDNLSIKVLKSEEGAATPRGLM